MRKIKNLTIVILITIVPVMVAGCGNQDNENYPYLSIHKSKLQPVSTLAPVGAVMAFSNLRINYCGESDYVNIEMEVRANEATSKAIVQPLLIKKPPKTINDPMNVNIIGSGGIFYSNNGISYVLFTIYKNEMCQDIDLTIAGHVQKYSMINPGQLIHLKIVRVFVLYSTHNEDVLVRGLIPIISTEHVTTAIPFYDSWE